MKLAIAYSTKDQVELTEQTFMRLLDSIPKYDPMIDFLWADASTTEDALGFFEECRDVHGFAKAETVHGGADAAIAWKLSTALASPNNYTHIMLLENDVLLDEDWFESTMALFEKGKQDGLDVGAVSARSYVDRVLVQRDGYAVMHNLGAGMVVFTREAAELVLRNFRTQWWNDNCRLFAQLAGIDLRTYAAFRGNQQWVTTDWQFEAQLAAHGLASLALTPARCQMVGQNPPLEQQGLELVSSSHCLQGYQLDLDNKFFECYRDNLIDIRSGRMKVEHAGAIPRMGDTQIFFPHMIPHLRGVRWQGQLELQWSQGFGPFAYRAGPGGASLFVLVSGTCSVLATGGLAGAKVTVEDRRSGFKAQPDLPVETSIVEIAVPGGPIPRRIDIAFDEGAMFYGLSTSEPQPIDTTFRFDWSQLPEAK